MCDRNIHKSLDTILVIKNNSLCNYKVHSLQANIPNGVTDYYKWGLWDILE